jgi:precorrin-6B methylase 1
VEPVSGAKRPTRKTGSLVVAGFGVRFAAHCTPEARLAIMESDIVYAVSGDAVAQAWLERLNPEVVSLHSLYGENRTRAETYEAMTEAISTAVRAGQKVCAVFYGHPGVYVYPSHEAIRRVRAEGYPARMLPGISSEDCLFADLGIDPGQLGCQSYEATDFLLNARRVDPTAALVLWQIGVIGDVFLRPGPADRRTLEVLAAVLCEDYPKDHGVIVYEAATLPTTQPAIRRSALAKLPKTLVTQQSTLYVPPREAPRLSARRMAMLGFSAC